ncbi:Abi family protein [Bifidobacterium scardovii]|uniref:Abi family protein n=1 Tax=Bifidobacterium scardovii TaxID=158787 RepID=UPI00291BCD52|nr:Abi family protein [Bifidobacterium scardovii]MDU8981391.1 Abi family protein [Bifidobacterium scardovii]
MKPAKNIDEMIRIMHSRGLIITDEDRLRRMLYNDNYYRLSGYFRVFQNDLAAGDNTFKAGTTDNDFIEPYLSDSGLRSVVLRGTAKVELVVRSRFAYLVAQNGGAYSYKDLDSYQPVKNRKGDELRVFLLGNMSKWMDMSKEVCIRHYRKSGEPVPIWAAMETMPFDTVSRMLSLHNDTKALRELYRSLGVRTNLRTSSEIIHAMVYSTQPVLAPLSPVASGNGHRPARDARHERGIPRVRIRAKISGTGIAGTHVPGGQDRRQQLVFAGGRRVPEHGCAIPRRHRAPAALGVSRVTMAKSSAPVLPQRVRRFAGRLSP